MGSKPVLNRIDPSLLLLVSDKLDLGVILDLVEVDRHCVVIQVATLAKVILRLPTYLIFSVLLFFRADHDEFETLSLLTLIDWRQRRNIVIV